MIKVIIAGSRSFSNYKLLAKTCDFMLQNHMEIEIVSGMSDGADRLGELYAEENGYGIKEFSADWANHGDSAGPIRNKQMAEYANALIAFWDGSSKGTKIMISMAKDAGIKVKVCEY